MTKKAGIYLVEIQLEVYSRADHDILADNELVYATSSAAVKVLYDHGYYVDKQHIEILDITDRLAADEASVVAGGSPCTPPSAMNVTATSPRSA